MMYLLIGIVTLFILIFYFYFGHSAMILFYQCLKHDVRVNYWELAVMKKNGVPINDFLKFAIKLKEKDIDVKIKDFELHRKSGGRVSNVVDILLKAKRNKVDLTYHQASIMDLDDIAKHKKAVADSQPVTKTEDSPETSNAENAAVPESGDNSQIKD